MVIEQLYLGIDPGSRKTGAALLEADGNVLRTAVLPARELPEALGKFLAAERPIACILGDGTCSAVTKDLLTGLLPGMVIHVVDETRSTEEARKLYWRLKPPRGWRSLLPTGMLVPPEPLDGYAAAILARRFLQK